MKKILIFLTALCFCLSCTDDKGNYTYSETNKISQEGLEKTYQVERYSEINIPCPKLNFTLGEIKELEYDWRINYKTISNEKDLKVIVEEELGAKQACLVVTEKATKLKYFFEFKVNIVTNYANGIHFLVEKPNGEASLTFMRRDKTNSPFIHDIYTLENPDMGSLGKKPKQLVFSLDMKSKPFIYVLCHEGQNKMTMIDKNTLKLSKIINGEVVVGGSSTEFKPDFMAPFHCTPIISNKKAYVYNYMGSGGLYRAAYGDYELAPYVYTYEQWVFMHWFAYDDKNQKAIMLTNNANGDTFTFDLVVPFLGDPTTGYTLKSSGLISVWNSDDGMSSKQNFSLALYNKTTQKLAFYEHESLFAYDETYQPSVVNTLKLKQVSGIPVDDNSVYFYARSTRFWYISSGKKLYKRFYDSDTAELIWTSTTGDITAISINTEAGDRNEIDLYVTTYDPQSSSAMKSSFYVINTETKTQTEEYKYLLNKCVGLTFVK